MDKNTVVEFARQTSKEKPQLRAQIAEYIDLMHAEIEEGGSESHEAQLCYDSIQELIKES